MAPLRRNHSKVLGYTCQGVIDAGRRRLGWTETGIGEQAESERQIRPELVTGGEQRATQSRARYHPPAGTSGALHAPLRTAQTVRAPSI